MSTVIFLLTVICTQLAVIAVMLAIIASAVT
jgi:hypothetical protein